MSEDLPSSGEPGVRRPDPASLPRPPLWSPGAGETPFRGAEEDTADPPSQGRRRAAFGAVAIMIVGVVLLGLALVLRSWAVGVSGLVVGAAGAMAAFRLRIMEDVSVSDSPTGGG